MPAGSASEPRRAERPPRPRDALGRLLPHGAPGVPPIPDAALPPAEALTLARTLVADGRAFSAHEVLEARWKACPAAERPLWQGLAQLCVGLTHDARGNPVGRDRLLERGAARLDAHARAGGPDHGLDLPAIVGWAASRRGTTGGPGADADASGGLFATKAAPPPGDACESET